jgi:superfamily I DNA/RNA helicase
MLLSEEQKDFLFSKKKIVYLLAFAGTGKTTSLVEYAKNNLNLKILYVAYNEAIVKESKTRFPSNTRVMTFHSLAYRHLGYKYNNKLQSYIPVNFVISALLLPKNNKSAMLSKILIKAIDKFCCSEFLNVEDGYYLVKDIIKNNYNERKFKFYLNKIWEKMKNIESPFPVTHDFYLKLYQLSNVELSYDVILFDESQDINSTAKSIVLYQHSHGSKIIFVGDKYQNIYSSFRNTENIFDSRLPNSEIHYLTKSFRFGKNIANYINILLGFFNEKNKLSGNTLISSEVNYIDYNSQYTIITRTNAMLIGHALSSIEKNKKIYFLDNKKSLNFQKIIDVYNLYNGETKKILNPDVKRFLNFLVFEKMSLQNDNKENLFIIEIVKRYKNGLEDQIKLIKKHTTTNICDADVILTTAHKAKGLEFNQVIMANDFYNPFDKKGLLKQNINMEELYVLYVAATRATYNLKPNKVLTKIIDYEKNK